MRKNPIRYVWMALGILCLVLGTIGVVLPILPTVPFYMATVFCFAKGSKRHANGKRIWCIHPSGR